MQRIFAFLGGILSGGAIGTAIGLLFTPASGDSMRQGVKDRYAQALAAGNAAAEAKRQALAAQLIEMTGPHTPDSPLVAQLQPQLQPQESAPEKK